MQIPVELILPPRVYMRGVDTTTAEFLQLCDSIREHGLHNSILVRLNGDAYELVDGAYRLAAHRHLRMEWIEAIVRDMTDAECLTCQVQANAVRRETSRIEFANHLMRIQLAMPEITLAELAKFAGKTAYWVRQQLDLLDLRPEYQTMADRGQLGVLNAYSLSRLPPHLQGKYLDAAIKLIPDEFQCLVAPEIQRLQMNSKDRSEATRIAAATSEPQPYIRPIKALTGELRSGSAARGLIASAQPKTHLDAFQLGVQWALNVDPISMEERKAKLGNQTISRIVERGL